MNDRNTWEWRSSIDRRIPARYNVGKVTAELCENALNDAKRRLHPLLRNVALDRLDQRGEFLQAFKSALETRIARQLAAWRPNVQAVFQFDERRIVDIQTWDGSIYLLAKVPILSNTVEVVARELDHGLVKYLTRVDWQRFRRRRSIFDVQQVTINELRHAVGYGAMFCAVYTVPVQVWTRDRQSG